MYIKDNIAYGDNKMLKVIFIKILDDFKMLIEFSDGVSKIFDFKALFKYPVYEQLANKDVFNNAIIDRGVITWCDGKIDIAPEKLYEDGIEVADM